MSAAVADKDKASQEHVPLLDFSALSPSALHSYISYYDLATAYPPPLSPTSSASAFASTSRASGEDATGSSSRGRAGANTILPSRLRARSPAANGTANGNASTHGNGNGKKRTAAGAGLDDRLPASSAAAGGAAGTEEEGAPDETPCPQHFFDAEAAHEYLSTVAARHFAAQPPPKEGEVVVGFLYRCRTKDKVLKVA